jgi:hypothetical protein
MGLFDLLDRVIDKKRVFQIGYLCLLTFTILVYFDKSWINVSLTSTPHGWVRRQNYWKFHDPIAILTMVYPLLLYSIYVTKKWCTECYIIAMIVTAFFWPTLLVNFAIIEAWEKYRETRKNKKNDAAEN